MANLSRPAFVPAALVALAAMLAAGCASSAQAGSPAASAKSCDQHKSAGPDTVAIKTVKCPAPAGSTTKLTITVSDSSGHPVTGAAVTLRSLMPSMGMSSDQITAFPSGSGYQASVLLGMSGTWQLAVTVVAPGVKAVTVQFAVPAS
ncbi:MAG TPA: FixH family protein [Streptosporangiaceae bacterium]|nr:FixH family protein [Streptosporangiaceae bacterium]